MTWLKNPAEPSAVDAGRLGLNITYSQGGF